MKLQAQYQENLLSEGTALNKFTSQLEDCVFDYFILIVKEYMMTSDKWAADADYMESIKAEYAKIDKEIEADEAAVPLPDKLTKELAEKLFSEKCTHIQQVYGQLQAAAK